MTAVNRDQMRGIFDNSQHLHKSQKCLSQMKDLYHKYAESEELLSHFAAELRRDILFTLNCDPKSPFTKHTIEFVANFLRSFSAPKQPEDTRLEDTTTTAANGDDTTATDGDDTIIDSEMAADDESGADRSDQENRAPDTTADDSLNDELGVESFGSESFSRRARKDQSTIGANTTTASAMNYTSATADGGKEDPTFADMIIKDQLIRFLSNEKPHIRYNCCLLIRKLFTDLEDMDLEVYEKLKRSLLDRLRDKDKLIRSAAALALHRFQESDKRSDLVSDALRFHLRSDPDFRVRQSCLQSLSPTIASIDEFINSTRDVKDIIRKTAFTLIADKFDIKNYGIDKRLQILKNGMNERHAAVRKVVETKLLPNWVKSYNGDFVALLYALDIQSDPKLIERMLFLYFDYIGKDVNEMNGKTGFHTFLDDFKNRFLEKFNLLTKEDLTAENAFLWRIVAKYCKDNEITVTFILNNDNTDTNAEEMSDGSQPADTHPEEIDGIDLIVPDLPHYCHYINVFIKQILIKEYEIHELMEFEFMFNQLLSMGELIDIGDDAQRQILRKCMIDILSNEELFNRIHNYVQHLMKIFAKNSDLSVYLEKTVELIDAINCQSIGEEDAPPPPSQPTQEVVLSADELKQLEIDYARLSIRVESLKDDLESAERDDSQSEADSIRALIAEYTGKMNDIMGKRLRVNVTQMPFNSQQSSQMSQNENRTQKTLTDDPIALERCLQIFNGCLEFGDFKAPHPMILTLIDKFVIPCILVPEIKVRERAVNCLGLSCLLSQELAKKHFALFVQILNFDSDLPQETALKCLFDLLCVHGLSSFDYKSKNRSFNKSKNIIIDDDENGSNDKENQSVHNNSTRRRSGVTNDGTESMDEDEDNDRTIINETGLDVLCSDSEAGDQEDVDEEDTFINLFTELLEKHLNSEMDSIKLITSQGIGKLFILGRMYSPQLLSKMILLWYDPDSSEELRQFLGVFLPIYSGVRMKANLKGENAFEECFLKTVEVVYNEALNYVNLDNLINFILELISDDGHKNLAKSVANRIITRIVANGVDDSLWSKYYLRVLSVLRLREMTTHDIKEYKLLIKKIEKVLNKRKVKTKLTLNRMQTIKSKIEKQVELIGHNSSQVSIIEDFGSVSLSQTLSQSISEHSHVDETMLDNSQTSQ